MSCCVQAEDVDILPESSQDSLRNFFLGRNCKAAVIDVGAFLEIGLQPAWATGFTTQVTQFEIDAG
jgi:hypothetical protein